MDEPSMQQSASAQHAEVAWLMQALPQQAFCQGQKGLRCARANRPSINAMPLRDALMPTLARKQRSTACHFKACRLKPRRLQSGLSL